MKRKPNNSKFFFTAWALLGALSMASCISDNRDNCDLGSTQVPLYFTYTLNEQGQDLFGSQVHDLGIYIYDKKGDLYDQIQTQPSALLGGTTLLLDLPIGNDYTVLAWANATDPLQYKLQNETQLSTLRMQALPSILGGLQTSADSLFHGIYQLHVQQNNNPTCYIDLMKNTRDIRVLLTVKNSPTPVSIGDYSVEISSKNGTYKFDNSLGNTLLNSIPHYAMAGADQLITQVRTQRLIKGDESRILIKNRAGLVYYDKSLTDDLMLDPRIITPADLDRIHRYQLSYEIDFHPDGTVDITIITIGDWEWYPIDRPLW